MDFDEIEGLISRFESGEELTRQQILGLFSSCKALIEQLEAHTGEYEALTAITEKLRQKLEVLSHELMIQHEMHKILSTMVRAMQGIFSEN